MYPILNEYLWFLAVQSKGCHRFQFAQGFALGIFIDSVSVYSEEVTIVVRIGDGSRIITVFRFFLANKGLGGSSDIFGGSGMSDSMSDSE